MKICSSCAIQNDDNNKFCRSCGKKLSDSIVCPYCTAIVKSSSNFCINCGKSLSRPLTAKPKTSLGNLTKVLIIAASFLGVIIITSVSLLLFNNYSTKATQIKHEIPQDWKQIKGSGLSIYLPQTWMAGTTEVLLSVADNINDAKQKEFFNQLKTDKSIVLWGFDKESIINGSMAAFTIFTKDSENVSVNIYIYLLSNIIKEEYEKQGYIFEIQDKKILKSDNLGEVGRVITLQDYSGTKTKCMQFVLKKNSQLIVFTFSVVPDKFESYASTFDKVIQTLSFE
jgi:hypothetical protein